jgi:hypothetical protein
VIVPKGGEEDRRTIGRTEPYKLLEGGQENKRKQKRTRPVIVPEGGKVLPLLLICSVLFSIITNPQLSQSPLFPKLSRS